MSRATTPQRFRFGAFELDARSGELYRDGAAIRLQEQPLHTLLILLEHAGHIVTHDHLRQRLWQNDASIDVDHGLRPILKRLRDALNDPADNPVFIETVPHRGYRFLAPVEAVETVDVVADAPLVSRVQTVPDEPNRRSHDAPLLGHNRTRAVIAALTGVAVVGAILGMAIFVRELIVGRAVAGADRQARLAVLPFDDLTGDDEQFFADGLHEEMILRLARMHPQRLAVIARTSVLPYRSRSKSIATIARELRVDYVLEGSVRRAGERFRITAQLIRADNQSHLWTETYDRSWKDIFAIQEDVGARVADSLAVELVPPYQAAVGDRRVGPRGYEHYLRGRFYWNQRGRDPSWQLTRAIEQFKLAIADQPDYALAYAGLADAYNSVFFASPGFATDAPPNARKAIQRALQLDDQLASAHSTLAWMTLHFDHDLPLAEQRFRRALELDQNDSLARFRLSHVLAASGRLHEAEREAETARQYDPLSAQIADILAWYAYYRGADSQALQRMNEAADLEGNPVKLSVFAAYLHAIKGKCDAARTTLGSLRLASEARMGEAAFAVARCGDTSTTESFLHDLTAQGLAYPAAMFHFGRGDLNAFYESLNQAIDKRFPELLYINVDPVFAHERQSPRFQAALRRLGM